MAPLRERGVFDPGPLLRQLLLTVPARAGRFDRHSCAGQALNGWALPTDRQIAERLGVSRQAVQRWRRGKLLRERDAERYALTLGLDPCLLWPEWYAS